MSALIFDRTQADADRAAYLIGKIQRREMLTEAEQAEYNAGLRGCYNITDLNRVEAKVRELAETLRSYGYSVDYTVPLKGASVLPSGYTELEYIQSSGTQYIDTGVVPSTALITEITFACESNGIAENAIFGSAWSVSGYFFMVYSGINGFRWHSCGGYADAVVSDVTAKHNAICQKGKLTLDGVEYTLSASGSDSTNAVRLFGVTSNEGYTGAANGIYKLYRCKMHNGNTVYRDFIPCKNPSGTVGLYDLVGGEFYTTPTAAGAVALPEGYTQVEYLQSSGTQYIDTGFKPNQNTAIMIDLDLDGSFSQYCAPFGARTGDKAQFWAFTNKEHTTWAARYATTEKSISKAITGRRSISLNKNTFSVDKASATFASASFQSQYNMWIFATNSSGTAQYLCKAKIYSAQIYDDGVLIRNFVPARNASGTLGLYDTVNGAFYTNAGSGTFTAGADINNNFLPGEEVTN